MHRSILFLILLSFSLLAGPGTAGATTLVHTNLDNKTLTSPLTYYNVTGYNQNLVYDSANAYGGAGSALKFDHAKGGYAGLGVLSGFEKYAGGGVYIRYWMKYDSNYKFPGELGDFENLKLFKLAGAVGWDIEFIYKSSSSGAPSKLQLVWNKSDGSFTGGTGTGDTTLGTTLAKGSWHKIEIYIKIATPSVVHVQVDDHDVWNQTDADIRLPASAYTGTQQFMSIRASGSVPPAGYGYYFTDNVTIVAGEGDLSNREPAEPSGSVSPPPALDPPAITNIQIK